MSTFKQLYDKYDKTFRKQLLDKLYELSPYEFEHFAQKLLDAYGFVDVEVTQASKDGGIDGYGNLKLGLATMKAAFQCKRWRGRVPRKEVDSFRGVIQGEYEQGIFLTTSDYTKDAKDASLKRGAVPIILLNGDSIIELMIDKELGVERVPLYIFRECLSDFMVEDDEGVTIDTVPEEEVAIELPRTETPSPSPQVVSLSPKGKGTKTRLTIIMPHGERISHPVAAKSFAEAIEKLGLEKVRSLGYKVNDIPLISTSKHSKYHQHKSGQYYIVTHSTTKNKKALLDKIASSLGVQLTVEIISSGGIKLDSLAPQTHQGLKKAEHKTLGRKGFKQVQDYLIPIIQLMKRGKSHTEAFHSVAGKLGINYSTVASQCTRTLNLNLEDFIENVQNGMIIQLMKDKYPQEIELIDHEFGEYQ